MIQNQSRLNELEKCPRRYAYRYLLGLAPPTLSYKMEAGLWVHAGLAGWYRSFDRQVALGAFDEAFKISPVEKTDPEILQWRDLWRVRLEEYCRRHKEPAFRVLMVPEQEIALKVGRHKLFTRLDLIIQMIRDDSIWVMDHKSTEKTGASYYPKYYVDKQGTSYLLAAEGELGARPAGWIINVIKSTKDNWFERQAFTRQDDQLESFIRQTEKQLDKLEEAVVAYPGETKELPGYLDENFPQYTHECHTFGTCAFLSICQAGLKAARSSFKKREPDYVDGVAGGIGANRAGAPDAANEAAKG